MPELTVMIPAYNESKNLALVLPRLNTALTTTGLDYEILIVDTVKPDEATQAVCEKNAARYINRGPGDTYGDANRSGIKAAQGDHIIIMDADGSHEPEFIHEMLKFQDEFDIVIASRYAKGGGSRAKTRAVAMSKLLNATYGIAFGLNYSDLSNSFKLYKAEVLKGLDLKCSNFDVIQEIIVKAKRRKPDLKIKELPYVFQERLHGESKREYVKFIVSYLRTLFSLRLGG